MVIPQFVAAFGAALVLVAPPAFAQEAPTPSDVVAASVDAIVTGYATGGDGGAVGALTASGSRVHWGTVATDWRVYPLGTRLKIEGFPDDIFVVEDTGGGLKGQIVDIWFPDLATAEAFGTHHGKVTPVVPPQP
jgi:3D (Asp-Asp-Asp) domain-containing protein